VCGIKGASLYGLIRKYSSESPREYVDRFDSRKRSDAETLDTSDVDERVRIPNGFQMLVYCLQSLDPDIQSCIQYVLDRGLTEVDMWRFRLGACTIGRYRRRVIVPSFDCDGELNYFAARSVDADARMKYINSNRPKKSVIFNEISIDWKKPLTIVEGPFDLVKCDDNATCLLGSAFNEGFSLFSKIVSHKTPVVLALDPDATSKTHKHAKLLSSYGIDVSVMDVSPWSDVGEMTRDQFISQKSMVNPWSDTDRLYHLIGSIRSGSQF
jgi:hypothetical protein